ncbi:type II secretion system F family protein [Candidatus Auribacterota bacterium]
MPLYEYRAVNKKGRDVVDMIEAASNLEALNKVRELGLYPLKVTETTKGAEKGKKSGGFNLKMDINLFKKKTVKPQHMVVFVRQFATLVNAGLPLLRCLRVLWEQQKGGVLKSTLEDLANSVESGSSFSEALMKHPAVFSKLFINMVKAGEAAGAMDIVLLRVADFYEKSYRIKAKVKSALIYPILVVCAAIAVLVFLVLFIIPRFAEMFSDMGLDLPGPTKFLIGFTNLMMKWYSWAGIFVLIGVIILAYFLISRTETGRYRIDKLKLSFPLFGVMFQKVAIARFARTLGTLIISGVPLLKALTIVKDVIGNEVIAFSIGKVSDSIREGESMSGPLRQHKVFSPILINMIDVGEETGKLDEMLIKIADSYDEDVDIAISSLTSVLEPVLIITLAVIVGGIVISLFLPLISLISTMGAM